MLCVGMLVCMLREEQMSIHTTTLFVPHFVIHLQLVYVQLLAGLAVGTNSDKDTSGITEIIRAVNLWQLTFTISNKKCQDLLLQQ